MRVLGEHQLGKAARLDLGGEPAGRHVAVGGERVDADPHGSPPRCVSRSLMPAASRYGLRARLHCVISARLRPLPPVPDWDGVWRTRRTYHCVTTRRSDLGHAPEREGAELVNVSEGALPPGAAPAEPGADAAPPPRPEARGLRTRITGSNMLGIILAADVVLILLSQFGLGTNLLGRGSLSTVTPLLGVLILVSLAQGVVIGTGGIDLSIPATITLVGSITLKASGGTNGGLGKGVL